MRYPTFRSEFIAFPRWNRNRLPSINSCLPSCVWNNFAGFCSGLRETHSHRQSFISSRRARPLHGRRRSFPVSELRTERPEMVIEIPQPVRHQRRPIYSICSSVTCGEPGHPIDRLRAVSDEEAQTPSTKELNGFEACTMNGRERKSESGRQKMTVQ